MLISIIHFRAQLPRKREEFPTLSLQKKNTNTLQTPSPTKIVMTLSPNKGE